MEAREHLTAAGFREAAQALLSRDPVRHTILLTAVAQEMPDAVFLTLHDNGELVGAVARTPSMRTTQEGTLKPGAVSMLWEVDGIAVAVAAGRGPIEGMARIAPVYTPPEHRGRGYASAATAAVSQWALDRGATDVLIFTDLTNSTTNHIYPAIGYQPVGDSATYRF